ncbi:MAG: hypothetical protein U5K70_03910 [Halodesulfurarchaeum sp.]|nr:hypothetical protein [Halodesulfurarchaeum sp.]
MTQQKSLDDLLVDEDDFNESMLTDVLAPFVGIGDNSGTLLPTDKFEELSAVAQTAVVLLARKATYEIGLSEEEGATPLDISQISGINHNTVKTAVRDLDEMNLVANDDGEYTVPTYDYDKAKDLIKSDHDDR